MWLGRVKSHAIYTHCLAKPEIELKDRTVYIIIVQGEVSKIGLPGIAQSAIKSSFTSLKQTTPPGACCIISLRLGRCCRWRIIEAEDRLHPSHTDHFLPGKDRAPSLKITSLLRSR